MAMIRIPIERRDDLVRVVRCKDCKWYHEINPLDSGEIFKTCSYSFYNEGAVYFVGTTEDDYCSHGERRENG